MGKKYIFITGGVVSGLGKGITAASLGRLLKNRGYKVINQKFDPYINIDPGTMDPCEHGEVFVTDDGAETDLDLGHYERFVDENLTKNCSITSGKIYRNVIEKERRGDYLGKTVQVIPHITNEIKSNIYSFEDSDVDIVITELGGTVGDIESLAFIEAIRQVGLEKPIDDVVYIHVTLLPYISCSQELKSKPTQHSVKELQSFGIKPDVLVCRSEKKLSENMREKIALFCNVRSEAVIPNYNAGNLYEIPLMLEKEGLAEVVCKKLNLENTQPKNETWQKMIDSCKIYDDELNIVIVGKYVQLKDSYLSIIESLKHAGYFNKSKVNIDFVDSKIINKNNVEELLSKYDGILLPGGFGESVIQGEIETAKYARENDIAFLGICLGMQASVIEFGKNVLNLKDEIYLKGEKIRLGSYPCKIAQDSLANKIYGKTETFERHRHIYEFNIKYKEMFENAGLKCSGTSSDGILVEIIENTNNKFFIGVQFNPEFKSRPDKPASVFVSFVKATKNGRVC